MDEQTPGGTPQAVLLSRSDQPDFVVAKDTSGKSFTDADELLHKSFTFPFKFPKLLTPIIVGFVVLTLGAYQVSKLEVFHTSTPDDFGAGYIITLALLLLFVHSLVTIFSASIILEMIQQWEASRRMSYFKAFWHSATRNLGVLLPLAATLTIKVFVINVISNMLKSVAGRSPAASAAVSVGEELAERYLQMRTFLVIPAVAWENLGSVAAGERVDRALRVFGPEFNRGFWRYNFYTFLLNLPVAFVAFLIAEDVVPVSATILFATIAYGFMTVAFSMVAQVLYTAQLYFWYLQYEAAKEKLTPEEARDLVIGDVPLVHLLENETAAARLGE
ncbi:hypothetical protein BH11PAT4_BH11PAT4_3680 [soil metagenome]